MLETPSVYVGAIDKKPYAFFVEKSDEDGIEGHYMSIDGPVADTLPFRMVTVKKKLARAYYRGRQKTFLPHDFQFDTRQAKGKARLDLFKDIGFRFKILKERPFEYFDNRRYEDSLFSVTVLTDIPYGEVMGYWTELGDEASTAEKLSQMSQATTERPLELNLNIYLPGDDALAKRPLVMLLHGGAFYYGTKDDAAITKWCRHLTSLGYVTASINYRLGFRPNMASIERAGYRAIQDAHAAMRFLVSHQEEFGIDTSMLFVGGASAGSITALNLVFMTNETRPEYSFGDHSKLNDLGNIESSGNDLSNTFRVKGVVDMWGALPDIEMMKGHKEPILAFHGDADNIVPYGYDFPFGVAGVLKNMLVKKMYGSSCIVQYAQAQGEPAHLTTFAGYKHSPHYNPADKALNKNFYLIQDEMTEFFHDILAQDTAIIIEHDGLYSLNPRPMRACWKAEGGLITHVDSLGAQVVWIGNAPLHTLTVSTLTPQGIGITLTKHY